MSDPKKPAAPLLGPFAAKIGGKKSPLDAPDYFFPAFSVACA